MTRSVALQRVIVSVAQLESALEFYVGVLGLEVTGRSPGLARLVIADQVELMLHERPTTPSDTAVAVGFATTRLDDKVTRWAQAGGVIVDPPEMQPWGERMAVLRDADGHLVCLSETP